LDLCGKSIGYEEDVPAEGKFNPIGACAFPGNADVLVGTSYANADEDVGVPGKNPHAHRSQKIRKAIFKAE